jgi:hypothetical protein
MRVATIGFCLLLSSAAASADTIVLKSGKKLEGTVPEGGDSADPVVLNPYNSRCPLMTYGITDKEKIPKDKVASVVIEEAPLVHFRQEASLLKMRAAPDGSDLGDSAKHFELAKFCEAHKLVEERDRELKLALCVDPTNSDAITAIGRATWESWRKGNPLADDGLRSLEGEYVKLEKPAELQVQWEQMTAKATTRARVYLERARRSAKFPLGRRDKVALTVRSEQSPGATYCIYLPRSYDPLVPTGLVVGLHGGGRGGVDPTLVTGNGEEAMNFYVDVADERGVIVVCPSAVVAGWQDEKNGTFLDAVLDEMKLLYNVDESRIWLTGHSMGGGGAWHWGTRKPEAWAAFSPCAGFNSGVAKIPVYIYHGTDDQICGVGNDRAAAESLRKDKTVDFVYTEIDKVGHGFPDWVRHDIFRFFTGRWKDDGKKRVVWPKSSFDRKVTKDEIKCFGDPAAAGGAAPADAKVADLCAALEKGGGRGLEASKELATHKDAPTVAAVGKLLHSKKTTTDTKVLAAKTLGDIGIPDCLKPLAAEAGTEDFRVLDAVVEALRKLGGKETVEPLTRAARQYGVFWEKGFLGSEYPFTELEIRCRSFGGLCDALAAAGDAAAAVPILEKEIVLRVFAPKSPYVTTRDERFLDVAPRARRELMERMAKCLVALKDPRGKALLETAKAPWKSEGELVRCADEAIAAIGG